jgi:putative hemolysin
LMHPQRMAIVLDEFGGTEGVVTFNDIVEEIIGDAVPRGDEELYIQPVGTSEWLVSGTARLDDLGDQVGKKLEYEGIDTISGLIFHHLGYLPKPGAKLEINSLQLEVRQSSRKRVLEVFVKNMDSGSKSTET